MVNTKILSFGALLASLGNVVAETAPGFSAESSPQTLNVTYGSKEIEGGELVPRADILNAPNISTPAITSGGKAILLMVDSDVPRNGTRVELLHWMVSGVTKSGNSSELVIPATSEAEYRPPTPPGGDVPHAYTFILFEQPDDFEVPEEFKGFLETRVNFNTSAFAEAAGLTQPALAANYLRVQNTTGTAATTFPPARPTETEGTTGGNSSTPAEFPGVASTLESARVFWVGVGTAMIAGVAAFVL